MSNKLLIFLVVFLLFFVFGVFVFFRSSNSLENQVLTNYNQHYQEIYSKSQAPESLFELFREKMIKKDKPGIKAMTIPFFASWNDQKKEESFNNFWEKYSQFNFQNASFIVKYDSSYYFEVSNIVLDEKESEVKSPLKIYFSRQNMQHLRGKSKQFPIQDYYVLVSENS